MTTLISYQGGTAGDLLTASFNEIDLLFDQNTFVKSSSIGFTVKDIATTDISHLAQIASSKPWPYVSTHEFNLLVPSTLKWISIEVTDPAAVELCVLRQMSLQRLRIKVDPSSHWYTIIKSLCNRGKYYDAANYWFEQARKIWIDEMTARLTTDNVPQRINFDKLFSNSFYSSVVKQGYNIPVLKTNHAKWLLKNSGATWTKESTISSMASKLAKMNWALTSGMITYSDI